MCVPAAEVCVEESVRQPTQRLHRRLESVPADIELDASLLRFLVLMHSCNFALQFGPSEIDFGKARGALSMQLGDPLGPLLGDLRKPLGAPLLRLIEHTRAFVSTPAIAASSRGRISRRIAASVISVEELI
jgi:hypothetical protein